MSKNLLLVDLQVPGCHRLAGGLVQDGAVRDTGGGGGDFHYLRNV
jgi:hypothetical protein